MVVKVRGEVVNWCVKMDRKGAFDGQAGGQRECEKMGREVRELEKNGKRN